MQKLLTERLLLRPLQTEDKKLYVKLHCCPNIMAQVAEPMSERRANKSFNTAIELNQCSPKSRLTWAVLLKEPPHKPLGIAGLVINKEQNTSASLGTILLSEFHRQGYATEILTELINYGFKTIKLSEITGHSYLENIVSFNLMCKLGFEYEKFNKNTFKEPGFYWLKQNTG